MFKLKPTTKRATKVAPPTSRRRKPVTPTPCDETGSQPSLLEYPTIILPLPTVIELEFDVRDNAQQLELIDARHKEIAEEETKLRERLNSLDREQQHLYLQRQCRTERLHYLKNIQRALINGHDHTGACVGNTASPF